MSHFRLSFGLLLFCVLSSLGCQQAAPPTNGLLLSDSAAEVVLDELREAYRIPALAVAIQQDGQVYRYYSGWADPVDSVALNSSHRMPLGSIGKTFVATRMLQLAEAGRLRLADPAKQYLAEASWYEKLPNAADITIQQLLNHTSGLPEYVYADTLWSQLKAKPDKSWTVAERMEILVDSTALFAPGSSWSYADANYIVLGAILEQLDEQDFYPQLTTTCLTPAGLSQTTPAVGRSQKGLVVGQTGGFLANIYGAQVSGLGTYHINPQFEWAGGGWMSTAGDLAQWISELMQGKLLKAESKALMQQSVAKYPHQADGLGYGLGLDIFATRYGTAYGHTGFMPGFQSFTAYYPALGLSLAFQLSVDPFSPEWPKGKDVFTLADALLRRLPAAPLPTARPGTTLYFVRHAEKATDGTPDPPLTEVGQSRAQALSQILQEAGITGIYSTTFQRTEQTAAPLATALGLEVLPYAPHRLNAIFEIIASQPTGKLLLVGHSNTTPNFINYILGEPQLSPLQEDEYDKLFRVVMDKQPPRLEVQSYGEIK
jgi:D-alanyl-D-alanine carboxypeptidase